MKGRIFAALMIFAATPTLAQQGPNMVCGQRDQIVGHVTEVFEQEVQSWGMAPGNRIMEVYASEETGSWSIMVTSANGLTCLMAAGQLFEAVFPQPAGEDL